MACAAVIPARTVLANKLIAKKILMNILLFGGLGK
jgi:hypothetical protein